MSKKNEAIATGRMYVDYDAVRHLKHLQAQIGWRGGYCIYLSKEGMQRLEDVIAFNEGREPAQCLAKDAAPAAPQAEQQAVPASVLAGMTKDLQGADPKQPGHQYARGWNAALRQAMDYARATPQAEQRTQPAATITIDDGGAVVGIIARDDLGAGDHDLFLAPQAEQQAVPDENTIESYMGPWIDGDVTEFRAALAAMLAAAPVAPQAEQRTGQAPAPAQQDIGPDSENYAGDEAPLPADVPYPPSLDNVTIYNPYGPMSMDPTDGQPVQAYWDRAGLRDYGARCIAWAAAQAPAVGAEPREVRHTIKQAGAVVCNGAVTRYESPSCIVLEMDLRSKYCELDASCGHGVFLVATERSLHLDDSRPRDDMTWVEFELPAGKWSFVSGSVSRYTLTCVFLRDAESHAPVQGSES